MSKPKDRIGKVYGRLTVIGRAPDGKWECRCECSTIKSFTGSNLTNGHSQSCGCLRRESATELAKHLRDEPAPRWDCAELLRVMGY